MNAGDFITPDISGPWVNQNKNLTTSDSPETLTITLAGTTAFSGISGWADSFTYTEVLRGGIIFYVNAGGFTSNGVTCHYLEAAPANLTAPEWGMHDRYGHCPGDHRLYQI
jgi:hypothetical protein